jgi:hypothetical protein
VQASTEAIARMPDVYHARAPSQAVTIGIILVQATPLPQGTRLRSMYTTAEVEVEVVLEEEMDGMRGVFQF